MLCCIQAEGGWLFDQALHTLWKCELSAGDSTHVCGLFGLLVQTGMTCSSTLAEQSKGAAEQSFARMVAAPLHIPATQHHSWLFEKSATVGEAFVTGWPLSDMWH